MTDQVLKLKNPPIVEAVLDIDCDLPPGQVLGSLEDGAKACFSDAYPQFKAQHLQVHQFAMRPGEPLNVSSQDDIAALQFLKDGGCQLVQVRKGGYSFNRLSPYSSFDDYLPEVERTWTNYVALAKPISIRTIRMRYINRIRLPIENGKVTLENYFSIAPSFPIQEGFDSLSLLHQHTGVELNTGNQVSFVFTIEQPTPTGLPVIFDNTVVCNDSGNPTDWPWILSRIQMLRNLKNRIFENVVTPQCLSLFQ